MNSKINETIIDVIGAGAMGLLFASRLKLAGNRVRLWCRTAGQANRIKQDGVTFTETVNENYSQTIYFDHVSTMSDLVQQQELLPPSLMTIIATKQHAIDELFLAQLNGWSDYVTSTFYICIQNGIGHLEKLTKVIAKHKLVHAVTSEAALVVEGNVRHTGYGITYLSYANYKSEKLELIEECLNLAGIQSLVSKSIQSSVYNKLIVNAVINPLTAIFKVENGVLPSNIARLQLMEQLFYETKSIIERSYFITLSITFDDIIAVCEKTSRNKSSMYADILNGRVTEIESINGAIVKLAKTHQLQAPINETLYLLILAQHP